MEPLFSPVSTNFWILSSRSVNIRPNLGAEPSNLREFDEKHILKFVAKSENSDFVVKFRPRKKFEKKLKKHFGYISTSSNRFGRKISKIHRYSRERILANFANFHQHFVIFHDKIKQKHKLKPNVDQNYAR